MKRSLQRVCSPILKQVGAGCLKTVFVAVVVGQAACLSWAGNGTWINAASGGLWSSGGNWSSGAVADGSGFTANFSTVDITADNTVHLDGPRTLTNLTFGDTVTNTAAGWILDNNGSEANVLTLAGTAPTLTVNALGGSGGVTLGVQLAGTAGLTKAGTGTLTLTSTNTYTGATTISGGTLALSGSGALVTNTAITINGGTLDMGSQKSVYSLGNSSGIVFGSNGGFFNGAGTNTIIGTGGLTAFTVPANATAVVNANVNITNSAAGANYAGIANVSSGGTLTFNGRIISYNSGGELWLGNGGTLNVNNIGNYFAGLGIWGGGGTITTTNFAALGWYNFLVMGQSPSQTASSFIYLGPATTTSYSFRPEFLVPVILNNGSGTLTFNASYFNDRYGSPASATPQKLTLGGSSDIIITGVIRDATAGTYFASLVKTNVNTLTLTGANTYSAGTVISGGTLQLGDGTSGRDGTVLSNIQNNAALVYNLYSTQTVNTVISGVGSVTKTGAGALTLASANTYSGVTTISGGTLKLGLANAITNTGAINVAGGTYDLGGFTATNGAVTVSAGTVANGTLVGSSLACTDAGVILANLAGPAGVTKSGAGTLVLRGASAFTGPLTISGGSLEAQASPAPGSAMWLDATVLSSLAKNADGTGGTPAAGNAIGRWTSLSGSNWVSTAAAATYQTNVLNGLPVLRFGGSMAFNSNVVAQGSTAFIVYKQTGTLNNYQQPLDSQGQTPTSGWLHMIDNLNRRCFVKGGGGVNLTSTAPSTNWAVQAVQIQTNLYRLWVNETTYSSADSTSTFTPFNRINVIGDIAEILIYTNLLSAADCTTTISYLQKKWLGVSGTSAVTNSLSPSLAAEVKAGAVLDLCGGSQTLAALSGSGRVTNGTVTVMSRLTPGDSSAAAGVLTVGGNLTLAAGATNVFDYVSATADTVSVAGTLTLQGANTVVLSLNGQPPPAQITLFTFGTLVGEDYLSSWSVQGEGLASYGKKVKRVGNNSVVLYLFRLGTLMQVL